MFRKPFSSGYIIERITVATDLRYHIVALLASALATLEYIGAPGSKHFQNIWMVKS
jgi:hypothetical protein